MHSMEILSMRDARVQYSCCFFHSLRVSQTHAECWSWGKKMKIIEPSFQPSQTLQNKYLLINQQINLGNFLTRSYNKNKLVEISYKNYLLVRLVLHRVMSFGIKWACVWCVCNVNISRLLSKPRKIKRNKNMHKANKNYAW